MINVKDGRKHCPACARKTESFWNYCVSCGQQLKEEIQLLEYDRSCPIETVRRSKDSGHSA